MELSDDIDVSCSLMIYGKEIELTEFIKLQQYGKLKLTKSGVGRNLTDNDVLSFRYTISGCMEEEMCKFIDIVKYLDFEKYKKKGYEIYIRIFVQSVMAQMYFELSHSVIEKLNELNLDVAFSVFSWGGVDDH